MVEQAVPLQPMVYRAVSDIHDAVHRELHVRRGGYYLKKAAAHEEPQVPVLRNPRPQEQALGWMSLDSMEDRQVLLEILGRMMTGLRIVVIIRDLLLHRLK